MNAWNGERDWCWTRGGNGQRAMGNNLAGNRGATMSEFADELRRLMAERGRGVREIARQVPCNPGYLSNLRSGKKRPSPQIAARLDDLLGADGGLAARARSSLSARGDAAGEAVIGRQEFLAVAGTLAVALSVLGNQVAADLPDRVARSRGSHMSMDAETVDGLAQVVRGFRQAYRSVSAWSLTGPVSGTLNLLAALVAASGRHQERVVSLIGQAASLMAAMLMLDLGDFATAKRYLVVANRAARQSGDAELAAISFGCLAFHAAYSGDPQGGLEYAQEGARVAAHGIHPRTHGWVAAVASEMHATADAGEESACRAALDQAAVQLSQPMPAEPWEGIGEFNMAKLTAYRGGDLVRLGRYREARAELGSALAVLGPGLAKHRCTAYVDLAEACLRDGDLDESVHHAVTALDIISLTHHAESLRRVQALYRLARTTGAPAARGLGQRLMETKAAM